MTAIPSATASGRHDLKVMSLVGTAHFFSHFYILILPPLFPVLREEYGVGYAALGLALAVLNGITGLTQAPVGFLVDRFGARAILIAGLGAFSLAICLVGVFPSYPMLLALMVLGGLGNSVFHPADYAILASAVDQRRMGRAFSIHTFGGYAGFALAPPVIVFLTAMFDWRIALMLSGAAGVAITFLMLVNSSVLGTDADLGRPPAARRGAGAAGVRLLLSGPILMALVFFAMLALSLGGFTSFSVAAIEALYRVPLAEASAPLTAYLVASAVGVLAGGWLADRTEQHHHVVGGSFLLVAVFAALIPELLPPLAITAGLFALAGFFSGVVAPSRDMMVRAVTPQGASGKVFGFVTTGFNIGGIVAPLLFGFVLDYGEPGLVFWTIAGLSLLTLAVVYGTPRSGPQQGAATAHR